MSLVDKITQATLRKKFKKRASNTYKGDFGHAAIIAGNEGKAGAAIICTLACLRSGAGLTTCLPAKSEAKILQISCPEAMVMIRNANTDLSKFTAFGMGPGLGINPTTVKWVNKILEMNKPAVMDADAITVLAKMKDWQNKLHDKIILTPHAGEFDRLFGKPASMEERLKKAIAFSQQSNSTMVLKDYKSYVIHQGNVWRNEETGNCGLAKGGSGDCLTGIITALLCQGYQPLHAAQLGIYLHGSAADLAIANNQSYESLLATDVIKELGNAFKKLYD